MRIEQLVTRELACIESTQASPAANKMRIKNIGSLLILKGSEAVGIIAQSDIVKKVVAFTCNQNLSESSTL